MDKKQTDIVTIRTPEKVSDGGIYIESFSYPNDYFSERSFYHVADSFALEIITQGKSTHLWNGESTEIKRGSVYLITPSTLHALGKNRLEITTIHFGEDSVGLSILNLITSSAPLSSEYTSLEFDILSSQIEKLTSESKGKSQFSEEMCYSILSQILITFFRKCGLSKVNNLFSENSTAREMIKYTMRNYRKEITLRDLAEVVGITPNYLGEIFIQSTGIPYTEYLKNLRLTLALQFIKGTDIPISSIGTICGFKSPSYFVLIFREVYSITPLQYRRTGYLPDKE